ncbi:hypothetical protein GH714_009406 [Hevea brasiliensis]|uniref:non-specific serine/threonine protein kinase n=1 Tax=Hevea brasiliensis TaxID=3981 RepID=A0A6A6L1U6_HEVBR|nr:hypothetical protein GH714_009406 [Hevea brasiliensis]
MEIVRALKGYMRIEEIWNEKNDNIFLKDNPKSNGSHNVEPNGSHKSKPLISSEAKGSHNIEFNGSQKLKSLVSSEANNGIAEQKEFTHREPLVATNGSFNATNVTERPCLSQNLKTIAQITNPKTICEDRCRRVSENLIRLARTLDDLENKLAKGENELAKENFLSWHMSACWKDKFFLDDDFEFRIAEYGHEKFSSDFEVTRNSARCMAPEYAITCKFTKKTIVYSYGVMLLEMITGKEAFDDIVEWGVPELERALSNGNYDFVDKRLKEYNKNEMNRMIACALACLRDNPQDQLEMRQIVEVLKGNIDMHDLLKRGQQLTKQVELTFGMESLPKP